MRVTSSHLIELAAAATSRAQQKVADATAVATSGLRVQVPSDDPVAWATAQRDRVRQTLATGTGGAIQSSLADVQQTESALGTIQGIVTTARALAVQGSSDTYTASDRITLGKQVTALYGEALAAANTQGADGHYLLAGAQAQTQPFDAAGVYHGDAAVQTVTTGENATQAVGVPGSTLTAAAGGSAVDILPELGKLATALGANDVPGIQAAITSLTAATPQLSAARGTAGTAINALGAADNARTALQTQLTGTISNLVEADAVGAASTLAQSTSALGISQAVSQHIIAALAPNA